MPWSNWITDPELRKVTRRLHPIGLPAYRWYKTTGSFETTHYSTIYQNIYDGWYSDWISDSQAGVLRQRYFGANYSAYVNFTGGTQLTNGPWFYGPNNPYITSRMIDIYNGYSLFDLSWWMDVNYASDPVNMRPDHFRNNLQFGVDYYYPPNTTNKYFEYDLSHPSAQSPPETHEIKFHKLGTPAWPGQIPVSSKTEHFHNGEQNNPRWIATFLPNQNSGHMGVYLVKKDHIGERWRNQQSEFGQTEPTPLQTQMMWPNPGVNCIKIHDQNDIIVSGMYKGPHYNPQFTSSVWYYENAYYYDYTFTKAQIDLEDYVHPLSKRLVFFNHFDPGGFYDARTSPHNSSNTWASNHGWTWDAQTVPSGTRPAVVSVGVHPNWDTYTQYDWIDHNPAFYVSVLMPPYRYFIPEGFSPPPQAVQPGTLVQKTPPLRITQRSAKQIHEEPRISGNTYW